ncbi:MAG: hypothetical protein HY720_12890 [Planctomycetes bacterium]|nr:hypothetical protein [Planctomycetota bacterium]
MTSAGARLDELARRIGRREDWKAFLVAGTGASAGAALLGLAARGLSGATWPALPFALAAAGLAAGFAVARRRARAIGRFEAAVVADARLQTAQSVAAWVEVERTGPASLAAALEIRIPPFEPAGLVRPVPRSLVALSAFSLVFLAALSFLLGPPEDPAAVEREHRARVLASEKDRIEQTARALPPGADLAREMDSLAAALAAPDPDLAEIREKAEALARLAAEERANALASVEIRQELAADPATRALADAAAGGKPGDVRDARASYYPGAGAGSGSDGGKAAREAAAATLAELALRAGEGTPLAAALAASAEGLDAGDDSRFDTDLARLAAALQRDDSRALQAAEFRLLATARRARELEEGRGGLGLALRFGGENPAGRRGRLESSSNLHIPADVEDPRTGSSPRVSTVRREPPAAGEPEVRTLVEPAWDPERRAALARFYRANDERQPRREDGGR